MIGNLSMNNNPIIKLDTPTDNEDAANKKYVDDNKVDGNVFLTRWNKKNDWDFRYGV